MCIFKREGTQPTIPAQSHGMYVFKKLGRPYSLLSSSYSGTNVIIQLFSTVPMACAVPMVYTPFQHLCYSHQKGYSNGRQHFHFLQNDLCINLSFSQHLFFRFPRHSISQYPAKAPPKPNPIYTPECDMSDLLYWNTDLLILQMGHPKHSWH